MRSKVSGQRWFACGVPRGASAACRARSYIFSVPSLPVPVLNADRPQRSHVPGRFAGGVGRRLCRAATPGDLSGGSVLAAVGRSCLGASGATVRPGCGQHIALVPSRPAGAMSAWRIRGLIRWFGLMERSQTEAAVGSLQCGEPHGSSASRRPMSDSGRELLRGNDDTVAKLPRDAGSDSARENGLRGLAPSRAGGVWHHQTLERSFDQGGGIALWTVPGSSARMGQSDSDDSAFGLQDLVSPTAIVRFDRLVNLTTASQVARDCRQRVLAETQDNPDVEFRYHRRVEGPTRLLELPAVGKILSAPGSRKYTVARRCQAWRESGAFEQMANSVLHRCGPAFFPCLVVQGEVFGFAAHDVDAPAYRGQSRVQGVRTWIVAEQVHVRWPGERREAGVKHFAREV